MLRHAPASRMLLMDPPFRSPRRTVANPGSPAFAIFGYEGYLRVFDRKVTGFTCTRTVQFKQAISMNRLITQTANGGDGLC